MGTEGGNEGISVDEIISNIDDDCGFIDERFCIVCGELLKMIDRERRLNGVDPYNDDQACILVGELYKVGCLFRDKVRMDGSSVFYNHLVGALVALLNDQGLTGLVSVLATLYHDVREDLENKTDCNGILLTADVLKSRIVDVMGYEGALLSADGSGVEEIRDKIWRIVDGVTKLREGTREGTRISTFAKWLEVALIDPRVINTKIADRYHNICTIGGHKNEQRQHDIMLETEEAYVPFTKMWGLVVANKKYVHRCMEFFNPSFLESFRVFSDQRVKVLTSQYGEGIFSKFVKKRGGKSEFLKGIAEVRMVFRDISYYTASLDKRFEELSSLDDLNISRLDPMHEWLVLAEKEEDKKKILSMILEKFASSKGAKVREDVPTDDDPSSSLGTVVTIFNAEHGGQLHFRINDKISEYRSKRGILAGTDDLTPENLRELITAVLDNSTQMVTGARNVLEASVMELLRPRITVLTRNGVKMVFPDGATALDFAAALSKELLIGLNGASMNDDVVSRFPDSSVLPFDKLVANKVYFVESCLSSGGQNNDIDSSKIEVDPGWLLFSQVRARRHIVSYLQGKNELASDYLNKIADIYGVSEKFLFELISDENVVPKEMKNFILNGVLSGNFNPVLCLANRFKEKHLWRISVDLEDRPGELNSFTSEFSYEDGFNLGALSQDGSGDDVKTIEFDVDCRGGEGFSVYRFFKKLLKLSYKYKIRLLRDSGDENLELAF